jgi:hypothetical protein
MPRLNPYRPGSLVTPGMFSGRGKELQAFEQALWQTKHGNPEHLSIMGERGIGKSSLFFLYSAIAAGRIDSLKKQNFTFVIVSVTLESSMTQSDILRLLGGGLRKSVTRKFPVKEKAKDVWDFLKRWEVLGVAYAEKEEADKRPLELLEQFTDDLCSSCEKVRKSDGDGIIILIDEADKPKPDAKLGLSLKLITEKLAKEGAGHVAFFIAGLPGLFSTLRDSHESSPRIFKPLNLDVLTAEDIEKVIHKGLEEANSKNEEATLIEEDATKLLCELSEGFPHFIQQYSYSAFATDSDNTISVTDVKTGAFGQGGAIEELGRKYFEELYYDKINSDDYRKVVIAMAEHGDSWVTKKTIKEKTKLKDATISNALNVMRERRVIIAKVGVRGNYRLPSDSFAKWVIQCGKNEK